MKTLSEKRAGNLQARVEADVGEGADQEKE